ncbi:MAG: M28 family peptidase [Chitinophagaceae bacterium]|nr:M28 family peptidase [Chitinophagaceae bacterium]
MKKNIFSLLLIAGGHLFSFAQTPGITGFSASSAQQQATLEKQYDAALSAQNIGGVIRNLSAFPHHLGSPGSKAVADSIFQKLKDYGWTVRMDVYHVLFPTPKTRILEMTSPKKYTALLKEPALKEDATSGQKGQLPTYNAWSADGDVTGALVFVNYGLPEDYETLKQLGVDVKGKIVIAKYGRSWRGIKPKVAQEHGAIGCIIYSDPADDGYAAGDVYPKGAYKNEYGVQRGSVMDLPIRIGDPLTPSYGSTADAKRIDRSEADNLLKIPTLPISYHDAQPLLSSLEGRAAPKGWEGALPFTYHIGDGETKVRLKLAFNWDIVPCYNVIATIPGTEYPDEWIIRGNHHDAWVNGAADPISGVASLLEEAKAIGALLQTGWRPKRTIVYCAWDGEEPAMLGSTEFVEDNLKELQQKAIVYINTDGNSRGFLSAGGSHAFQTMTNEIARDVTDPQTNVSVLKRKLAKNAASASSTNDKKDAAAKNSIALSPLGSGSDYTAFLQHAGIPALNLGYGGEGGGGEYHSIYDTYDHYSRFKDPGFLYGVTLAQTVGRFVLRLAGAEILPFDYTGLVSAVDEYAKQLIRMTDEMRQAALIEEQLHTDNIYALAADPTQKTLAPEFKGAVPHLDFSPLQNALTGLQQCVDGGKKIFSDISSHSDARRLNAVLYQAEQQLLLPKGLPGRSWYKHAIYAPGLYTGYGVKTLPGIRESIEERQWEKAQEEIHAVAEAINKLTVHLQPISQGKK